MPNSTRPPKPRRDVPLHPSPLNTLFERAVSCRFSEVVAGKGLGEFKYPWVGLEAKRTRRATASGTLTVEVTGW